MDRAPSVIYDYLGNPKAFVMSISAGRMGRGIAILSICCAAGGWWASASAAEYITFDVPGSTSTEANLINAADVAGTYSLTKNNHGAVTVHGFIRHSDGTIESFDPVDSVKMYPTAMNGDGIIIGEYIIRLNHGRVRGFMRSPDGSIADIRVQNAKSIYPASINAAGWVVGDYELFDNSFHAFLRAPDGSITTFQVPGADSTSPVSINKSGAIAGDFTLGNSSHGFVRNPDGSFVEFDVPKAVQTYPRAIDNAGRVVGSYFDRLYKSRAFLREADGKIIKIEAPGTEQTFAADLSAQRNGTAVVTGYGLDSANHRIGFIRNGQGEITTFQVPGSENGGGTSPISMNGQKWIVGAYSDISCCSTHAFIRIP